MIHKKLFLAILLVLVTTPFTLAQYGYSNYGFQDLTYFLDNPNTMFVVIFLIFFAILYYAINKSFDNRAIAAVISLGISLIIALALARRGLLFDAVGGQIGSWILITTVIAGIVLASKFALDFLGTPGVAIISIVTWLFIRFTEPYIIFPQEVLNNQIFGLIYLTFLRSIVGLIFLVALSIFIGQQYPHGSRSRRGRNNIIIER